MTPYTAPIYPLPVHVTMLYRILNYRFTCNEVWSVFHVSVGLV